LSDEFSDINRNEGHEKIMDEAGEAKLDD